MGLGIMKNLKMLCRKTCFLDLPMGSWTAHDCWAWEVVKLEMLMSCFHECGFAAHDWKWLARVQGKSRTKQDCSHMGPFTGNKSLLVICTYDLQWKYPHNLVWQSQTSLHLNILHLHLNVCIQLSTNNLDSNNSNFQIFRQTVAP